MAAPLPQTQCNLVDPRFYLATRYSIVSPRSTSILNTSDHLQQMRSMAEFPEVCGAVEQVLRRLEVVVQAVVPLLAEIVSFQSLSFAAPVDHQIEWSVCGKVCKCSGHGRINYVTYPAHRQMGTLTAVLLRVGRQRTWDLLRTRTGLSGLNRTVLLRMGTPAAQRMWTESMLHVLPHILEHIDVPIALHATPAQLADWSYSHPRLVINTDCATTPLDALHLYVDPELYTIIPNDLIAVDIVETEATLQLSYLREIVPSEGRYTRRSQLAPQESAETWVLRRCIRQTPLELCGLLAEALYSADRLVAVHYVHVLSAPRPTLCEWASVRHNTLGTTVEDLVLELDRPKNRHDRKRFKRLLVELQRHTERTQLDECPICFRSMGVRMVLTCCMYHLCSDCLRRIQHTGNRCPMRCSQPHDTVVHPPPAPPPGDISAALTALCGVASSTECARAVLAILRPTHPVIVTPNRHMGHMRAVAAGVGCSGAVLLNADKSSTHDVSSLKETDLVLWVLTTRWDSTLARLIQVSESPTLSVVFLESV
jgi:hypothetical protein